MLPVSRPDAPQPPPLPPALRREQLLIRSTRLRLQFAQEGQVLAAPLAVVDKLREAVQWLKLHPEWPVGGLVLLALLRPRRAWRWAGRVWWAWRLWQRTGRPLFSTATRR